LGKKKGGGECRRKRVLLRRRKTVHRFVGRGWGNQWGAGNERLLSLRDEGDLKGARK